MINYLKEEKEGIDKLKLMTYTDIYHTMMIYKEESENSSNLFSSLEKVTRKLLTSYENEIKVLKDENKILDYGTVEQLLKKRDEIESKITELDPMAIINDELKRLEED